MFLLYSGEDNVAF